MGILELIKLNRVKITTVHYVEDVVEYDECGLTMKFRLNRDYVADETIESEFDAPPSTDTEETEDDENE